VCPKVKSSDPPISFKILVRPQASSYDESRPAVDEDGEETSDEENEQSDQPVPPSVELLFELPEDYPNVKPSIQALNSTNLGEDELSQLLADVDKRADESLGSVMIFMLVSEIVVWLSTRAEKEADEHEREKGLRLHAIEAEERKKAEGTPVTVETFLAWKAKFDAEQLKIKLEEQKQQAEMNSGQRRLTGREMFERDKALAESDLNFVDDLEQDQIEALLQDIDEVDLDRDYKTDTDEETSDSYDSEDKSD